MSTQSLTNYADLQCFSAVKKNQGSILIKEKIGSTFDL